MQSQFFFYKQDDTTQNLLSARRGVAQPGVHVGYIPSTSGSTLTLSPGPIPRTFSPSTDIEVDLAKSLYLTGFDENRGEYSLYVTRQGVTILEDEPVVINMPAASAGQWRRDALVLYHTYGVASEVPTGAQYGVVEGAPAASEAAATLNPSISLDPTANLVGFVLYSPTNQTLGTALITMFYGRHVTKSELDLLTSRVGPDTLYNQSPLVNGSNLRDALVALAADYGDKIQALVQAINSIVPKATVMHWYGDPVANFQMSALAQTAGNYGKGIPGTSLEYYALCLGQNILVNGQPLTLPDLRRRSIISFDPDSSVGPEDTSLDTLTPAEKLAENYRVVGNKGGKANFIMLPAQMPKHNHQRWTSGPDRDMNHRHNSRTPVGGNEKEVDGSTSSGIVAYVRQGGSGTTDNFWIETVKSGSAADLVTFQSNGLPPADLTLLETIGQTDPRFADPTLGDRQAYMAPDAIPDRHNSLEWMNSHAHLIPWDGANSPIDLRSKYVVLASIYKYRDLEL